MENEYNITIEKIKEYLKEFLPATPNNEWYNRIFPGLDLAPEMVETLVNPLLEPGRELFNRGGKHWRPLLSHLVCQALGGGDEVLPLLPLIEYTHNASLIHDDLEDNSEQRRGKPAIHLIFGSDTAINSGSFLYLLPLVVLENWKGEAEDCLLIWRLWSKYLRFLHLGQSIDISWHRNPSIIPSMDDYMFMCSLKTGCLARFAALLGAETAFITHKKASDASKQAICREHAIPLGDAAQKFGVGYQILDDVKNLSTGVKGKKRGDDVVEGKKSLPVLLFLQDQSSNSGNYLNSSMNLTERTAFIQKCFAAAREGGISVPEVEEFIETLSKSGALAEAEKRGKALIAEARETFSALPAIDAKAVHMLTGLTELLQ